MYAYETGIPVRDEFISPRLRNISIIIVSHDWQCDYNYERLSEHFHRQSARCVYPGVHVLGLSVPGSERPPACKLPIEIIGVGWGGGGGNLTRAI